MACFIFVAAILEKLVGESESGVSGEMGRRINCFGKVFGDLEVGGWVSGPQCIGALLNGWFNKLVFSINC